MAQVPPKGPVPDPSHLDELGNPAPLKTTIYVVQDGDETALVEPGPSDQPETPSPTSKVVDDFTTVFKTLMFDDKATLADLNKGFSTGVQLIARRADILMTTDVAPTPDNADTLLQPAVDSVFKFEPLLRMEDPALLRNKNTARVRQAVTLTGFYSDLADILEPLYFGAINRKRQAQGETDAFCRYVNTDGDSAINRNALLRKGLSPLRLCYAQAAQQAQDTKHLKEILAHEIEAKTIARVVEANQGTPLETPSTQGVAKTPLVGAHAPGQNPVPPGAMPIIPQPQHPKPPRRSKGAPVPRSKKKPPTTPWGNKGPKGK